MGALSERRCGALCLAGVHAICGGPSSWKDRQGSASSDHRSAKKSETAALRTARVENDLSKDIDRQSDRGYKAAAMCHAGVSLARTDAKEKEAAEAVLKAEETREASKQSREDSDKVRAPNLNSAESEEELQVDVVWGSQKVPRPAPKRLAADREGLRRFTVPQKSVFERAMREIKAGKKETCWMWYMVPTPPYIVDGVEKGSARNQKFSLRSDKEVLEYLKFQADGVNLRQNYFDVMTAIRDQMRKGYKASRLLGMIDEPKFRSSVKLFERVTRGGVDEELHEVMAELLRLLGEHPEKSTVQSLSDPDSENPLTRKEKVEQAKKEEHDRRMERFDLEALKKLLIKNYGSLAAGWKFGLDQDKNGKITFAEFSKAVRSMGFHGDIKAIWKELNTDGNQDISLEELDPKAHKAITEFKSHIDEKYGGYLEAWQAVKVAAGTQVHIDQFKEMCEKWEFQGDVKGLFKHLLAKPAVNFFSLTELDTRVLQESFLNPDAKYGR